ncbi:MAG TPA: zinc-dependent metalloprotease, partial [Gemmatimonadales bacterium]
AHEVGHTIGLAHNYIASTQGRASVMDYPHPVAKLKDDGTIDLSDAYLEGIGEWDKVAVTWGYQDFPEGTDQRAALERIIIQARDRGLTFLTDQDARPTGSAHPGTHLWDNGADVTAELTRMMAVRRAALTRFGENAIRRGMPLALLEEALVPLYLHHRYQVEAAVKLVGGQSYGYALRGDGQEPVRAVPAPVQEQALRAVLGTLRASELKIPERLLQILPPRPAGFDATRELFDRETGPVFDAIRPAASAADLVASLLLDETRAARLVQQHALDPSLPGLEDVIDRILGSVFTPTAGDAYESEIQRAIQRVVVERVMDLAAAAGMSQVRAIAAFKLEELRGRLAGATPPVTAVPERAHRQLLASDIRHFQERDWTREGRPRAPVIPPGSPIGTDR